MELMIILSGFLLAITGGLALRAMTRRLKRRLRILEENESRRQAELSQKLDDMFETAQQQFAERLNLNQILSEINAATQQAVQQINILGESQRMRLEVALQQMVKQSDLDEVMRANSFEQLSELKQRVEKLLEEFQVNVAAAMKQREARQFALEQETPQFLTNIQQRLTDWEQKNQTICATTDPFQSELPTLSQEFSSPNFSVVPVTISVSETMFSEIRFETAFIDHHKKIRRDSRTARQCTEFLPNGVMLEMIYIPGGSFIMGSETAESEKPVRRVTLKPFLAGKYPITQAQWEAVLGSHSSKFKGANRPVEMVNWHDAVRFCVKLSRLTGNQYQLLSEAQWEYACRAGSTTMYSFGDNIMPDLANYEGSGIKQTSEVGKYPANAFGLYDMHGNVWEWCADVWHENYLSAPNDETVWNCDNPNSMLHSRLLRGGSWYNSGDKLSSSYRIGFDVSSRYDNEGFRVMRELTWA